MNFFKIYLLDLMKIKSLKLKTYKYNKFIIFFSSNIILKIYIFFIIIFINYIMKKYIKKVKIKFNNINNGVNSTIYNHLKYKSKTNIKTYRFF